MRSLRPERDDEHPHLFQKGVPLHPKYHFWGNVMQYAVKNSHFCCLKELGHAVSYSLSKFTLQSYLSKFNCSSMPPSEKQIAQ